MIWNNLKNDYDKRNIFYEANMAKIYDTMISQYITNPGRKWLSLDDLAVANFEYKMISYEEVSQKWELNFQEVALKYAWEYSAEDVLITRKLYDMQKDIPEENLKVAYNIEFPLIKVLQKMETTGVKVDTKMLEEIGMYLREEIKKEEEKIYEIVGETFNISSPKQVWEILFDKMWLPSWKKTKTWYSVDVEVLEWLSFQYPIAKHILLFRQYSKLLSTYVEWLSKLVHPQTGRIHTSYNQTIAATGRLSSTAPNLQNIPSSSSGVAGEIRKAFVPFGENDEILAFDYSQIEVRLLAIMSEDENLLGAFQNGVDIHSNTWYFLFAKDELTSDERKIAKAVNFWVIYGISPFWLSKMIGISQADAKIYITKFFERYPKVEIYFQKIIDECEKNGYVQTLFGRKRYIAGINDKNMIIKKAAQREAMNMPIQGTSADIIKLAMIQIDDWMTKNNFQSKMLMQVHDELVFNVVSEEKEIFLQEIPKIMEHIIPAPIKLKVDAGIGKNWKEAK